MKIIHVIDSQSWDNCCEFALACCRAAAPLADVVVMARGSGPVASRFKAEGFSVAEASLGGMLDFLTPLRLMKAIGNSRAVIHIHSTERLSHAASARRLATSNPDIRVALTIAAPAAGDRRLALQAADVDGVVAFGDVALPPELAERVVPVTLLPPAAAPGVPAAPDPTRIAYIGPIDDGCGLATIADTLELAARNGRTLSLDVYGEGQGRWVMQIIRKSRKLHTDSFIHWAGAEPPTPEQIAAAGFVATDRRSPWSVSVAMLPFMAAGAVGLGFRAPVAIDGLNLRPWADTPEEMLRQLSLPFPDEESRRASAAALAATFSSRAFAEKITRFYNSL